MGFHLGGGNAQSRVGVGLSHVRRRMKDKTGEYLDVEIEMAAVRGSLGRIHVPRADISTTARVAL